MAKRFEKMNPDKKGIKKEEKKIGVGKAIVGGLVTVGSIALAVVTKGKLGGSNKA